MRRVDWVTFAILQRSLPSWSFERSTYETLRMLGCIDDVPRVVPHASGESTRTWLYTSHHVSGYVQSCTDEA